MPETLSRVELVQLVKRVFRPREEDRALAVLVDLPDAELEDNPRWQQRRAMANDWVSDLQLSRDELGLEAVDLVLYRNVRRNNADLPASATVCRGEGLVSWSDEPGVATAFSEVFDTHQILLSPTELSATAPLKLAARKHGFRAATMPGFSPEMIPALRLDYREINERCQAFKVRLDQAVAARIRFLAEDTTHELVLDLRHRHATASGGLLAMPGSAGNLPSGETYIVPYEGEREGDPSMSQGTMPLELDGELLYYRIHANKVVEVLGNGPRAIAERAELSDEPAYGNLAELGLGVLASYGLTPIGELLLDEKLGLHIATGRSDHFGGQVGAKDFSSPGKVVHIDRVYIPEIQPQVRLASVDLEHSDGTLVPLIRDWKYV